MLNHAIQYGRSGWKVFPINGKKPSLRGWQSKAASDSAAIGELFKNNCFTGVACMTGEDSGIAVVDVDRKNGKDGFLTLKNLGIELPATVSVLMAV